MEFFIFLAYFLFAVLSVAVAAFAVWIIPPVFMTLADHVLERTPVKYVDWITHPKDFAISIIGELMRLRTDLAVEKCRHRRMDHFEGDFYTRLKQEFQDVREGKAMPVSLRG